MEIDDEVDIIRVELTIDAIEADPTTVHTLRLSIPVALELDVIENFKKNDPLVAVVISDEPIETYDGE